ncbi:hypothetical protein [Mammaliicoccus sp. Dog046]|uniref:hypothetical protein n=1 Tax=Mammaliicoccus sp. Dog046 TaxID=3034233 RepID=UPI002B25A255|nr:hypothetical protein [Mammaliicoccus sp. Dog046]WQK86576.1 hypothetical protein P3U32_06055 [Mammaliicoccus sp. Dog046]
MEIGIIIFVIYVLFSIVSGIIEGKSKNNKKNNKIPRPNQQQNPVEKQGTSQQELQNLKKKYEAYVQKAEASSTKRMSDHYHDLANKLEKHLKQHNIDVQRPVKNKPVQQKKATVQPVQDAHTKHDNAYLNHEKEVVQKGRPKKQQEAISSLIEFNNEEKKSLTAIQKENISKVEEEANEIIYNTQLSERTRRSMIKQLYLNSKHKFNDEAINIDENQIVNGIIWSEILKRPKEL